MTTTLEPTLTQEILTRCDDLARYSEDPDCLTRTFLCPSMLETHSKVRTWMEEAGMTVRLDAVGNLIGRYEGTGDKTFLIGSHLDTVKNAGKYDGMLGVLAGIATVKAFKGRKLPFALELLAFSEEEGVRFNVPFFGSRAVTGTFDPKLLELRDAQGVNVREAINAFCLNPEEISAAAYKPEGLLGFLELHIEQGPQLAALEKAVGVVSTIVGQSRAQITFTGKAGHAGTSPMHLRQDALAGAAAFVLAVESHAKGIAGLVATVGKLETRPGAMNVIPGEVVLTLDLRHEQDAVRKEAFADLQSQAAAITEARTLTLTWQTLPDAASTPMDAGLREILEEAAGTGTPTLVSGAGHDAMILAPFTPSALLFVRSPNGISHNPEEMVWAEDVAEALRVMVNFIERLEATHA